MSRRFIKLLSPAIFFIAATSIWAQGGNFFSSGEGGFAIDMPRDGVTVTDGEINDNGMHSVGKQYEWKSAGQYLYKVGFYFFDKPALTLAQRAYLVKQLRDGIVGEAQKSGLPTSDKAIVFKGNKGIEVVVIVPGGKLTARMFATSRRFYHVSVTSADTRPESASSILNSFRFLNDAELKAVKIEEATPLSLPQEPPVKRLTTDAKNDDLKGRVKSTIESTVYLPENVRLSSGEKYYDMQGTLTKEVSFDDGYPFDVQVWGNIDGNRVTRSGDIDFDDDQIKPSGRKEIIQSLMESPGGTPGAEAPGDLRYSTRYEYKYDDLGRLAEISQFDNHGALTDRIKYAYTAGRREKRSYWDNGEENNHTVDTLDDAGNVTETVQLDEKGKVYGVSVFKYEFDAAGNWIVQRVFEKKTIRGRVTLKPVRVAYRTIAYYQ
jgi:hypothetical protein